MKIAIVGQQDFGKAVLEAFLPAATKRRLYSAHPRKEARGPMCCAGRRKRKA